MNANQTGASINGSVNGNYRYNGQNGAAYGAPAQSAPAASGAPYGAAAVLPRYGGPGAYYGTHAPAMGAAAASPYAPPPGPNGMTVGGPSYGATGGPVVSPTRPSPTNGAPVVAPTGPPPAPNAPRSTQRPTWVSLINRMGAAAQVEWRSGAAMTGNFRVPQGHAHVFMAPAPMDSIRVYALTSDGPPRDPVYDGPRQPPPGIPEPGPGLNLLATGCGVFETMLDFYPGTASGSNDNENTNNNNGNRPGGNGGQTNNQGGRGGQPLPLPPTNGGGGGYNNGNNATHMTAPTQNGMPGSGGGGSAGLMGGPRSVAVGSFGTWRATDIAAAWARTCHGGQCNGGHPAETDTVAPYTASVIPAYRR